MSRTPSDAARYVGEVTELRTALYDVHLDTGASLTNFAGWQMPVRYGSDIAEHTAVRSAAGLFDLSHMAELMVRGSHAAEALDFALVSRVSPMALGRAKYSMVCAEDGGVIDDVVVYRRDWDHFMVVANASNRDVVTRALTERVAQVAGDTTIDDHTESVALIAVQGPRSARILQDMCQSGADDIEAMRYYSGSSVLLSGGIHAFVARTGYTGEDGFEIFAVADRATDIWQLALARGEGYGLIPCGLAARDSLRLEAGMPLYGQELTRTTTPFDAGLGRVVHVDRPDGGTFVGQQALRQVRDSGPAKHVVGLIGTSRRAARTGDAVVDDADNQVGVITSGLPSPTLGTAIAMAYVPPSLTEPGTQVRVDVRGRGESMKVVALPFYQRGAPT